MRGLGAREGRQATGGGGRGGGGRGGGRGGGTDLCMGGGRGGGRGGGERSVWVIGPGAVVSEQHEEQDVCL